MRARDKYVLFSCSCTTGQNRSLCKHVLYEGVRVGSFEVPEKMGLANIGRKPKKGRPANTQKKKVLQPGEEAVFG